MKQAPQFILKNQNLNVKCVTVISVNLKTNKKSFVLKGNQNLVHILFASYSIVKDLDLMYFWPYQTLL